MTGLAVSPGTAVLPMCWTSSAKSRSKWLTWVTAPRPSCAQLRRFDSGVVVLRYAIRS